MEHIILKISYLVFKNLKMQLIEKKKMNIEFRDFFPSALKQSTKINISKYVF